jgi:hypothetical protein
MVINLTNDISRSTDNFNEMEWLNNYFTKPMSFTEEDIKSILFFALIWNMFESLACKQFANVSAIQDIVNEAYCQKRLQTKHFAPFLCYFQSRYVEGKTFNKRFYNLNFRKNDKQKLVEDVLKGDLKEVNNLVLALLLIVYRLRNNLFHGGKNVCRLNDQEENFEIANQILTTFLDSLK